MQDLIEFIDFYTLDSKLYFQVPKLYSKEDRVEIQWMSGGIWRFKEEGSPFWVEVSSDSLVEALTEAKADLVEVEKSLFTTAIEQIVGASFIVEAGKDFFGEDTITDAIEQYQQFHEKLLDTLDEVIDRKEKEEAKPKLSVVKSVDIEE